MEELASNGERFIVVYQSPMAGLSIGMAITDGYLPEDNLQISGHSSRMCRMSMGRSHAEDNRRSYPFWTLAEEL